ncbi:Rqc2 family fibronectin-binding protein [Proteocatella sphenisci]|uniref:Rqc2 family fibronectin-binding protein n=1 Tax=Proteocatella sphenisci TaxID=181070 RepID=UPI00048E9B15|nr:NFACT RNA binding domain-containing protein [Proteocatella sphenisci]
MPLDGLTLHAAAHELNASLVGGKIDKIGQAENDEILLSIRNNQKNYKLLMSANSANPRIYLVKEYKKENPMKAPMFLMILRKHIGGGRIMSVSQNGFDRSVTIKIEAYDEMRVLSEKLLIIEMMGKHSNIILVDAETNKVIDSIKRVSLLMSSVREVLPNREFTLPPEQNKKNPLINISLVDFVSVLKNKDTQIFKAIYGNFEGISPIVAKEICFRSSIDYSLSTYELTDSSFETLKNCFDKLFNDVSDNNFYPNIVMDKRLNTPVEFSSILLTNMKDYKIEPSESISEICEQYFALKDLYERIHQRSSGLKKSIQIKLDRVSSKLEKQTEELSKAYELDKYSKTGELLKANIYMLQKGMKQVTVIDYFDENTPQVTIPLDEHLTPSENIQASYKKYNKSKNRIKELGTQIEHTRSEMDYLDNVMVSINNCTSLDSIEEIKEELVKEGYYSFSKTEGKKNKKDKASEPMEFIASDGTKIFVGKNNTQNDKLTLKMSRPDDVWLHTKNIPGSHVIIKQNLDDVSEEALYEAARLAAYYSKARTSSQVPVDYTQRKNVKKPNGAKPGLVIYDDYGTLYVTPDEELVYKLMKKHEDKNEVT